MSTLFPTRPSHIGTENPAHTSQQIFVVLIVTVCILVNNLAFGMFRSKTSHMPPAQPFFPPNQHQQNSNGVRRPKHRSIRWDMMYTETKHVKQLCRVRPL